MSTLWVLYVLVLLAATGYAFFGDWCRDIETLQVVCGREKYILYGELRIRGFLNGYYESACNLRANVFLARDQKLCPLTPAEAAAILTPVEFLSVREYIHEERWIHQCQCLVIRDSHSLFEKVFALHEEDSGMDRDTGQPHQTPSVFAEE